MSSVVATAEVVAVREAYERLMGRPEHEINQDYPAAAGTIAEGEERRALAVLARDIFNPFRPVTADPSWLTSTVVALAHGTYAKRAFDRLPILADALQDAGCEDPTVLDHLRRPGPHVRGCWAVDLVLGRG